MKEKSVELKIPIEIISKIDKVRKRSSHYAKMSFSDYVNMLLLRAVDDEQQRMKEYKKPFFRRKQGRPAETKVIAFPYE